uniref:Uncharacterized protein n=1 Tax=Ciona savignyi TaxID=51511 RepID=H2YVY5_CIOSA
MAWCESFPEFMRQNCEETCCERELNVLLDSPPVGWTAWTSWGTCPAPCGQTAVQSRTRTCPLGEVGIPPCIGPATESRVCHPAMVCASWSQWQPWYACSVTCEGVGTFTTRFRTCQGGNSGDRGCEGMDNESQPCGRGVCPEPTWAPWSTWSDCSYKRRTRTCVGGTSCPGESREFTECPCGSCNIGVARSTWGSWMPWTACSARCGQGFRRRARICGQTGVFFQDCDGSGVQIASCSGSCRPI